MKLLNKYKWHILTIIVLFCVGLILLPKSGKDLKETKQSKTVKVTKHSKKSSKHSSSSTSKVSSSSSSEQPQQSQVDQATEQYGYTPGYGGVSSDSPEIAREQSDQQARENWHDSQVEWAKQQGLMD